MGNTNNNPETKTYHEQKYIDNTLRLRAVLKTLPPFAKDYFRAVEPTTSARTRISYAYDIRVFFHFLMESNPLYKNYTMNDFTLADLEKLEPVDIEEYQEYLKVYENGNNKQITNTEKGLSRKMSALRSFYGYFYKRQAITKNPTLLVDMPKLHEKAIIRLDADEVAKLLDYVDHGGDNLTGQRKAYFEKTKNRDLAILTLLLGTGIRVSECVGLDIQDVDFKNNGIKVTRKGETRWSYILVKRWKMPLNPIFTRPGKTLLPCRDMKMPSSFPLSAGVWVSRQLKIWSANMPVK